MILLKFYSNSDCINIMFSTMICLMLINVLGKVILLTCWVTNWIMTFFKEKMQHIILEFFYNKRHKKGKSMWKLMHLPFWNKILKIIIISCHLFTWCIWVKARWVQAKVDHFLHHTISFCRMSCINMSLTCHKIIITLNFPLN
jgi:hypothetical protein